MTIRRRLATAIVLAAAPSSASPNVSVDDPVYEEIDQLELAGALMGFRGGLAPLTEARVHELLPGAPALPSAWWLRPIARGALRVEAERETFRPYSTAARQRNVAGVLALSCEDQEGRPCGNGLGASTELDAAGGYGAWSDAAIRVRAQTGTGDRNTALVLDRAYLHGEIGPIATEIGRDIVMLGPAAPTLVGWGANPAPLDHVRISGSRPLALSERVRLDAVYVLGRLAAPQTYPSDLISMARAQVDIDRISIGAMQLLQLGGEGAPGFGVWDFVLEHVRRRDATAGANDSSNRRVGLDVAAHIALFGGTRITYQMMFEDLRKELVSAVRYDADHVLSLQTRCLTVELQRTGVRSYEHAPRVTGFTTGGRIVGDPLGPAAQAVLVIGRISVLGSAVMPWGEVARLASDSYAFPDPGPVTKTGDGTAELRFRIGARARVQLADGLEIDPEIAFEDVERASFVPGVRNTNALLRALLVWRPAASSTTLRAP